MVAVQTLESMLVTFPDRTARYHLEDLKYLRNLPERTLLGLSDLFGKVEREWIVGDLLSKGDPAGTTGWEISIDDNWSKSSLEYLSSRGYINLVKQPAGNVLVESTPVLVRLLASFHRSHERAKRSTAELFRIKHETELARLGLILPEQDRSIAPSGDTMLDKLMEINRITQHI